MKSKNKIRIIILSGLAALLLTHIYVMPNWALIHAAGTLGGAYQDLATTTTPTVAIRAVDTIYMGWQWFLLLLIPIAGIAGGSGYYFGRLIRADVITTAVTKKVSEINSKMKVSTSGVLIGGFRADDVELWLKREFHKLHDGQQKLKNDRELFMEEVAQHAKSKCKESSRSTGSTVHTQQHRSGKSIGKQPSRPPKTAAGDQIDYRAMTALEGDEID